MPDRGSALVTILFTDLVGSTEPLSRAGDEEGMTGWIRQADKLIG
jgi:class 3 adenylate cyclase